MIASLRAFFVGWWNRCYIIESKAVDLGVPSILSDGIPCILGAHIAYGLARAFGFYPNVIE